MCRTSLISFLKERAGGERIPGLKTGAKKKGIRTGKISCLYALSEIIIKLYTAHNAARRNDGLYLFSSIRPKKAYPISSA